MGSLSRQVFCTGWCIHIIRFALLFWDSALVCLCGIWAVLGFELFQWHIYIYIYISAMALPLQLPLALTLLSSGLFFGFAPNFVGCLLLERHSVDSDESLRWRVCPALEFCTACVEDVCSSFSLCFWACRDLAFHSGAGWSPGHSALSAWGMKTVFIEPLKTVLVSGCAPRGPLFLHE